MVAAVDVVLGIEFVDDEEAVDDVIEDEDDTEEHISFSSSFASFGGSTFTSSFVFTALGS